MATTISEAFQEVKIGEIEEIITRELHLGREPYILMKECQLEMENIGKKFESGEYYLAELLLSTKMFKKASEMLFPKIGEKADINKSPLGKIVLGTPKGDVHDLGKDIFALLAKIAGFEVIDLGVDVHPQRFLDMVKKESPNIIGMSALITTTFNSMKEIVDLLMKFGLREKIKVIIGGGATGEEVRRYIGADAQTLDAAVGVRICKEFIMKSSQQKG